MGAVYWCGRAWHPVGLPPGAALHVARLAHPDSQIQGIIGVLDAAGIPLTRVLHALEDTDTEADILDLVSAILMVGTARPWKATVGLCRTVTAQWSTIRGRLIDKGIPDPLRALPSLTALLDVVEIMILDSMEKDEDRQRFLRDLYRRDNMLDPPPGWAETSDLDGIL